jgi:transposase InsO family protein
MPKKRFSAEQIVTLLRQIEVSMAQGKSAPEACRDAGISLQLRDELLNGEIFYSLKEAQIVIEQWRRHYNTIRPLCVLKTSPGDNLNFTRHALCIAPGIAPLNHC